MTMNYGLTPAEQAAQRATQRADDTRIRRAQASTGPVTRTGTDVGVDWTPAWGGAREPNVPVDFTLRTRSIIPPMSNTLPVAPPRQEINPLPITPKPYVPGPMTGPASRDWQTGMSGLPAFEPKVPLDFSRAGIRQTLGRSPVPPMQQEINPLQLPYGAVRAQAAGGTMRPPIRPQYDAPMPMPMPTLHSRIGPMTGPTIRRGTDIGVDTSPWWSGGAFEPNSTGIPWDFGPSPYYPMRQVVEGF